jgi:hypothetical protein|tara:strand:- start:215 stop:577 length:363 start_codon:yes stop_codon:yes gene_type:complete
MGKIINGTASVLIDGSPINIFGDITYSIGVESAESQLGVDGHYGVNITKVPAFIEIACVDDSELDLGQFQNLQADVQCSLRNGKIAVWHNAYQINQVEVTVADGKFTLRFETNRAEEIAA